MEPQLRDLASPEESDVLANAFMDDWGLIVGFAAIGSSIFLLLIIVTLFDFVIQHWAPQAPWIRYTLGFGGLVLWIAAVSTFVYFIHSSIQSKALAKRMHKE